MKGWILAFDRGCGSCRSVSDRVSMIVSDGSLMVRDLAEPEVVKLRHQALGTQPPWLPTLIAVEGDEVRAWTGTALSIRLAWLLGPARSFRVIRALAQEDTVVSPDRRRFLKAIPGAAAGAVVLSGGVSGGAALADTRRAGHLDVKRLHGAKATATLDRVASDKSVRGLAQELGMDPREALENGVVEQLPQHVQNGQRYVSVLWVDDSQQTVRTSHFVTSNGAVHNSSIFRLLKAEPEIAVQYGELGGKTQTLTESQAQERAKNAEQTAAVPAQGFFQCGAECLGIPTAVLIAVVAGCTAACAVTAGTACIVCAAGALGMGFGVVSGCFLSCA